MHPIEVAGAAPDKREPPLSHQLDQIVGGAWPVESAVSQGCATSLDNNLLDVAERRSRPAHLRPYLLRGQRILLAHRSVIADLGQGGDALRNDVRDAGRLGGGQQVVRSLSAQPVGVGGEPLGVPEVGLAVVRHGKRRHLVRDRIRPSRRHRLAYRRRIQAVHHNALGAQLLQQAQFGRARRRGCHLVPTRHQLWHQTTPDDPGPACHEHPHNVTLLIRHWFHHQDETARQPVTWERPVADRALTAQNSADGYPDAGSTRKKRVSASASSIGANSAMWWPESMPCPSTAVAQFRQITSGSP